MNARNVRILEAASNLFSRYGVGKTTMNDIAAEAGVARQTLYNAYPSKDEVLRATVRLKIEQTHRNVISAWDKLDGFEAKLDAFFEHGPINWYDLTQSSPETAELLDGLNRVAKVELDEAATQWAAEFEKLLAEEDFPLEGRAELADFIYGTSASAKYNSKDRQNLLDRLNTLKACVSTLVSKKT